MLTSLNSMGDHHGISKHWTLSRALEQGQDRRPEGTFQTERHLGAAGAAATGVPSAGTRPLQLWLGQQATKLRSCQPEIQGRLGPRQVLVCTSFFSIGHANTPSQSFRGCPLT